MISYLCGIKSASGHISIVISQDPLGDMIKAQKWNPTKLALQFVAPGASTEFKGALLRGIRGGDDPSGSDWIELGKCDHTDRIISALTAAFAPSLEEYLTMKGKEVSPIKVVRKAPESVVESSNQVDNIDRYVCAKPPVSADAGAPTEAELDAMSIGEIDPEATQGISIDDLIDAARLLSYDYATKRVVRKAPASADADTDPLDVPRTPMADDARIQGQSHIQVGVYPPVYKHLTNDEVRALEMQIAAAQKKEERDYIRRSASQAKSQFTTMLDRFEFPPFGGGKGNMFTMSRLADVPDTSPKTNQAPRESADPVANIDLVVAFEYGLARSNEELRERVTIATGVETSLSTIAESIKRSGLAPYTTDEAVQAELAPPKKRRVRVSKNKLTPVVIELYRRVGTIQELHDRSYTHLTGEPRSASRRLASFHEILEQNNLDVPYARHYKPLLEVVREAHGKAKDFKHMIELIQTETKKYMSPPRAQRLVNVLGLGEPSSEPVSQSALL